MNPSTDPGLLGRPRHGQVLFRDTPVILIAEPGQKRVRGDTLYVLDVPTGLHPSVFDKLMAQFNALVEPGNTAIVFEREMKFVAASDWVVNIRPGAGDKGGRIDAAGPSRASNRRTAANRFTAAR